MTDRKIPKGTILARIRCPACGHHGNVTADKNGKPFLICGRADPESLAVCNSRWFLGNILGPKITKAWRDQQENKHQGSTATRETEVNHERNSDIRDNPGRAEPDAGPGNAERQRSGTYFDEL